MSLHTLLLLALAALASSEQFLTVGPRTTSRLEGIWPNNIVYNGTEDATPFFAQPIGEDINWCDKIKIPAPGMAIQAFGVYMATAGINVKLYLYDDSELGRPKGNPLVARTFISEIGQNQFNFTTAERAAAYWSVPVGGSDFIWLCLIHGVTTGTAAPAAQFFVTGGAGTDGPKKSVVFNGADYNWDNAGLLATTDYFQLKTNVWVYGPSLATDTPTPTSSASATPTVTLTKTQEPSLTPSATASPSRTATSTGTRTPTGSPIPTHDPMYYIYNGVPAPSEVLTIPWVDFHPNTAMVGEEITARVMGWHNFWVHDIYLKVGRGIGYDDCYGVQEGSSIQLMVNQTIKLRALKADTYRVCYKLRNDWEPLERKFTVVDPSNAMTFLGYNSCSEFMMRNSSTCGCFLGTVGEHVHVPATFPLNLLIQRQLDKQVDMGCCVDNSLTRVTVGSGREDWGWCTNDPNVHA
jgi:hypothetical protein|uniref:Uncharacterized protein n=1 Tax=Eutreptiella gymnastica TaxID=73025 RepID=A0A7S4GL75_9EUGL|mmetsp:Transcript_78744/g.132124  ORF Transcript_78744/g.132124 Transcript_78744/m.132124 type:complete len:465 (+) Transcript_78744:76-1470(+)|eukprot:CAMPEP_0174287526 /NCGR_PEP_ID=MMETSP0809-20121228/16221_1 /TAXON_ID=73025 ORGANISM="Eutreptiella gymnastica-like, Strain CCMP1594" /NCGR_SAMPLE_ID=MMETSP0809 /ASSEMBLY_ACC=CAM_ASM_000658 /LENGTH=464 /DNA_ID=CAMNT_0015384109 /DNA_START=76 /DNA_END=1470 /DNA_ORIENTATION=-